MVASDVPLVHKLGIAEGTRLAVTGEPAPFRASLGELPLAVEWANRVRPPLDLIVSFHTSRAAMVRQWPALTGAVVPTGGIWVAWPKKTSGVATDISDAVVREELLSDTWVDNKVCSIDDVYTALRFVRRRAARGKTAAAKAAPAKLRQSRTRR